MLYGHGRTPPENRSFHRRISDAKDDDEMRVEQNQFALAADHFAEANIVSRFMYWYAELCALAVTKGTFDFLSTLLRERRRRVRAHSRADSSNYRGVSKVVN